MASVFLKRLATKCRRVAFSVAVLSLVAACAGIPIPHAAPGVGPVTQSNWPELVAKAVPAADGAVEFESAAAWPDDESSIGVMALTRESILFMQWSTDASEYRVQRSLPYANILSVQLEKFAIDDSRVLVMDKAYQNLRITLLGHHGIVVSPTQAKKAAAILEKKIPKS